MSDPCYDHTIDPAYHRALEKLVEYNRTLIK